jgi:hypothetical protein
LRKAKKAAMSKKPKLTVEFSWLETQLSNVYSIS